MTSARAIRVGGSAFISILFCLESGCGSGRPPSASSSAPALEAYEGVRARAWDPSRRFKALFKAEVSPKVGAIAHGYLSVWWEGAAGALSWRSSAPVAGAGRGGSLRKGKRGDPESDDGPGGPHQSLLPGRLTSDDLLACMLGVPESALSPSSPFEETPRGVRVRIDVSKRSVLILLDRDGSPIELSFPSGEIVKLQPGEGVPRRIEANGPEGRAVLTLESYGAWPAGEEVPPQ